MTATRVDHGNHDEYTETSIDPKFSYISQQNLPDHIRLCSNQGNSVLHIKEQSPSLTYISQNLDNVNDRPVEMFVSLDMCETCENPM